MRPTIQIAKPVKIGIKPTMKAVIPLTLLNLQPSEAVAKFKLNRESQQNKITEGTR